MSRLLFVQDNGVNENIGVMSIAAVVRQAGHDVDLILVDEHPDYLTRIRQIAPDLIGFSFMTGNRRWAFDAAQAVKACLNVPIIFGGVHATLFPEDIDFGYVDYVCVGEGEYPTVELMEELAAGRRGEDIENLWVKMPDGSVKKNPLRDLIQDFDQLPLPYRELYYKYPFIRDLPIKRFVSGIGCPFQCTFCHNPMHIKLFKGKGKFVRKKSVERVIAEILQVKDSHVLKRVHFSDDLFVLDRQWLTHFLGAYRRDVQLPFSCNIRVDRVDEAMIRDMAQSGCWGISFGIESGSEYIRNTILKKNLKEEDIVRNAALIKKHGIKLIVTNLLGLPDETLDDAFATIKLNQRIRADYIRANVLVPYPKTGIVDYAIKRGLLPDDFSIHTFDQNMRHAQIKSPYAREFENLCALFNLTVKFPFLTPLSRHVIKFPVARLFSVLRLWEGFENMLYHQLFNPAGFRYLFHIARNVLRHVWS